MTSVRLSRNSIEVKVEPHIAEKFGVEDFAEVTVEFEVDDAKYQAIVEQMRRIFNGYDEYHKA